MTTFFESPRRVLNLSHILLSCGTVLLAAGVVLAYGMEQCLSLHSLLIAHAMTILGPTAIKLGYVGRLCSINRLRRERTSE
ncbi:transmembrane sensor/regulator PpyR [Pseudomonas paraeruginosa]|nr:transmembrane sensor/regulator PpyR [Pseudomonas paraeruginosa]MDK2349957.1 transmembrane sensor/regulator PpyR [Pseudomonas paraeruginosa]MEA8483692.1 transmembrane sensor/regulator PpyR [Pseudomonas aeruginosa]